MTKATETGRNRAAIAAAFDGLDRADPTRFIALFDPDMEWQVMGTSAWSKHHKGMKAIERDLVDPLFARFAQPYRNTAELIIAEGDRVVVLAKGNTTTHEGERYANDYCFVFTMRDGRIVAVREYMDTKLADAVLGT